MSVVEKLRKASRKTIGSKETRRALEREKVERVFIARDADDHVVRPVLELSKQKSVEVSYMDSMVQLGKACGISVGAAAAAILQQDFAE